MQFKSKSKHVAESSNEDPDLDQINKAFVRLCLQLSHLLLMQLHHTALSHTAVHDVLRTVLSDPLFLTAITLTAFLIHQRRSTGIDFLVAVVGRRIYSVEAGAPSGNGGIARCGRR